MGGTPLYVLDRQKKIQNASLSSWQRWRPLQTWMYFWVLAQSHVYLHLQLVVYEAKPNKVASQQPKTEERDTGGDLAILPRNETFATRLQNMTDTIGSFMQNSTAPKNDTVFSQY